MKIREALRWQKQVPWLEQQVKKGSKTSATRKHVAVEAGAETCETGSSGGSK
jgi:hypothetical protein